MLSTQVLYPELIASRSFGYVLVAQAQEGIADPIKYVYSSSEDPENYKYIYVYLTQYDIIFFTTSSYYYNR